MQPFDDPNLRTVSGRVHHTAAGGAGAPAAGTPVCLFDESGPRTLVLDKTVTDAQGRYQFAFLFKDGQQRWVGVPASGGGFDPKAALRRTAARKIEQDLALPPQASTLDFIVHGTARRADGAPDAGAPLAGIVVTAFTEGQQPLAPSTTTDAAGQYVIRGSEKPGATLWVGADHGAGALVRSSSWTNAGGTTLRDLLLPALPDDQVFIVRGKISGALPAQGVVVRAYDQDMRGEELLGECTPGSDAGYEIRYQRVDFSRNEAGSADLRLRVYAGAEALSVKTSSPTAPFNADRIAVIDIEVLAAPQSEYEHRLAVIAPVRGAITVADLTAADIDFIHGDTGIDRDHLAWLSLAAQREKAVRDSGKEIPAAAFYGWFREGVPSAPGALERQTVPQLRSLLTKAIDDFIVPASLRKQLDDILAKVPNRPREELADLVAPLALPADALAVLGQAAGAAEHITDSMVGQLFSDGLLNSDQAHAVGLSVSLHGLLEGDAKAAKAIAGLSFEHLPGGMLRHAADLAMLSVADWTRALQAADVTPPDGAPVESHALWVSRSVAQAFPTDTLLYRATDTRGLGDAWTSPEVQALRQKNRTLLDQRWDTLDTSALTPDQIDTARTAHARLLAFTHLHPGLALTDLYQQTPDAAQGASLVAQRVAWFASLHRLNQAAGAGERGIDLLQIDYLPNSTHRDAVKFGDVPDDVKPMLLANLKSYQRVQAITTNAPASEALLKAGFGSATRLALASPEEIAEASGLSVGEATLYQQRAEQQAQRAALRWFSVHDTERDRVLFNQTYFTAAPSGYLAELPGYTEMFNNLTRCECDPCSSVLSPAAYFVDLLFYVEQHILRRAYTAAADGQNLPGGLPETHLLHLKSRRPDLWDLPLTCDNTKEVVPTLDLVNEILAAYITGAKGLSGASQPFAMLALQAQTPRQPANWPLVQLGVLLEHFELDRLQIGRALSLPQEALTRARLGLSLVGAKRLLDGRMGNLDAAATLYGDWLARGKLPVQADQEIRNVAPRQLLRVTGLDHRALLDIATSAFVSANNPQQPVTVVTGVGTPGGVQNDTEWIEKLSIRRLDRFEVFVRLGACLPWSVAELDQVLASLLTAAALPTASTLDAVARLRDLQERLQLPVDELCALWGDIPQRGLLADASLWDRRFNLPQFARADGPWPPASNVAVFLPAALSADGRARPADGSQQRLMAALQIDDAELVRLFTALRPLLEPPPPGGSTPPAPIAPTRANLVLLYRHARLARALGIGITALFQTMAFVERDLDGNTISVPAIRNLADLLAVVQTRDALGHSGYTLDEARHVCDAAALPANALDTARELQTAVQAEGSLGFAATVFTQVGLGETHSRAMVEENTRVTAGDTLPIEANPGTATFRLCIDLDDSTWTLRTTRVPAAVARASLEAAVLAVASKGRFVKNDLLAAGLSLSPTDSCQALLDANTGAGQAFEAVGDAQGAAYRLRAGSTQALVLPAGLDASRALALRARNLLLRHHWRTVLLARLSVALKLPADRCNALYALALQMRPNLADAVPAALHGNSAQAIVPVLAWLSRLSLLYKQPVFDAETLGFVGRHPAAFGLSGGAIAIDALFRAASYATLAQAGDPAYASAGSKPDVAALRDLVTATTLDTARLSRALGADASRIDAVLKAMPPAVAGTVGLAGVTAVRQALALADRLGLNPELLKLALWQTPAATASAADASAEFEALQRAADGVLALFRARYPDETVCQQKLEPFEDRLRSRQRDLLVEFLTHDYTMPDWQRRFQSADDLYDHFLMDVQVEGCARTSRLVAATSSVQLYVHRVLMRLERVAADSATPLIAGFASTTLGQRKAAEWVWRKNYRVWEANRKVFLYPENYIEPGLRDDKTPLFRELEDTLLQQEITEQNVLDAYARYMAGFDEIAHLKIAGAYHDKAGGADTLHLFGVTESEPPVYYYRAIDGVDDPLSTRFGHWSKLTINIPVRKVAAVVTHGRLYVFWIETATRPLSDFKNGSSAFRGYRHSVRTKFSQLRLDGKWSAPETLRTEDGGGPLEMRIVPDLFPNTTLDLPYGGAINFISPFHPPWDTKLPNRLHLEPVENYAPRDWRWDRIYPNVTAEGVVFAFGPQIGEPQRPNDTLRAIREVVDFSARISLPQPIQTFPLSIGLLRQTMPATNPGWDDISIGGSGRSSSVSALAYLQSTHMVQPINADGNRGFVFAERLIRMPSSAELQTVAGNEFAAFIEPGNDALLFKPVPGADRYTLQRLGTTIAPVLQDLLSTGGVSTLLALSNQIAALIEKPLPVSLENPKVSSLLATNKSPFDKSAALAGYYREIYFHIPFLIADHLNSRQQFGDAQRWYHHVFDPTAAAPPGADERLRPWRYKEFRDNPIAPLDQSLTNADSLQAYHRDPFNPHAIARLRPGAYQKSVVMKYIDNLIDWGDSLFAQFTMESVNEATMLYVMAAEVLGPKPEALGPCGEKAGETALTYADAAASLRTSSEVLIEATENLDQSSGGGLVAYVTVPFVPVFYTAMGAAQAAAPAPAPAPMNFAVRSMVGIGAGAGAGGPGMGTSGAGPTMPADPVKWNTAGPRTVVGTRGTPLASFTLAGNKGQRLVTHFGNTGTGKAVVAGGDPIGPSTPDIGGFSGFFDPTTGIRHGTHVGMLDIRYELDDIDRFPPHQRPPKTVHTPPQLDLFQLAKASVVFCLPDNKDLRAYWDRVESALFKIRNCMDITGVRRRIELFAPEIDPRLLVRMKAAGLSLDDVLNATRGDLPPYRFSFLIDKAKQHAGLVQGFGSQLMAALEKRDAEELTRLRTVHEQNLMQLRSSMMQWEIDAADDTVEGLNRQKAAAEFRRDYYDGLLQQGLVPWERTQQVATHMVSGLHETEAVIQLVRAGLALLPDIGAPTSMKYGGIATSGAASGFASASEALAQAASAVSASAGLEASFQRRENDWKFQFDSARRDIEQFDKQIAAAEIRRDIATQSREVHLRSIEQTQEVYDFMRERFTNFGRYTWLSERLQGLNRMAFDAALAMARLAEEAYRFERPEQSTETLLGGGYWDAANAGLLAGERLQLDLHNLERRYLETNYRQLEVEQSFSLQQMNPSALVKLRQTGTCSFKVDELFMDLAYPGHYRRRIKSVRLTLPCVAGPYVNVGAMLSLTGSRVRMKASDTATTEVPLRHLTSVAASSAQNDAGVFEFSFRDERYMPFEGAGAISDWELRLPSAFPSFDHKTLSDVILRIAYTSAADDRLRTDVEGSASTLAFSVARLLEAPGLTRVFSLRHDFPAEWSRLVNSPIGTEIPLLITPQHLPYLLSAMELDNVPIDLLLATATPTAAPLPEFAIDGEATRTTPGTSTFVADPATGLLMARTVAIQPVKGAHRIRLVSAGALAPAGTAPTGCLEVKVLNDILWRVQLKRRHV